MQTKSWYTDGTRSWISDPPVTKHWKTPLSVVVWILTSTLSPVSTPMASVTKDESTAWLSVRKPAPPAGRCQAARDNRGCQVVFFSQLQVGKKSVMLTKQKSQWCSTNQTISHPILNSVYRPPRGPSVPPASRALAFFSVKQTWKILQPCSFWLLNWWFIITWWYIMTWLLLNWRLHIMTTNSNTPVLYRIKFSFSSWLSQWRQGLPIFGCRVHIQDLAKRFADSFGDKQQI